MISNRSPVVDWVMPSKQWLSSSLHLIEQQTLNLQYILNLIHPLSCPCMFDFVEEWYMDNKYNEFRH